MWMLGFSYLDLRCQPFFNSLLVMEFLLGCYVLCWSLFIDTDAWMPFFLCFDLRCSMAYCWLNSFSMSCSCDIWYQCCLYPDFSVASLFQLIMRFAFHPWHEFYSKDIRNWIKNIEQHASDNVNKILVGNKADMDDRRVKEPDVSLYSFL